MDSNMPTGETMQEGSDMPPKSDMPDTTMLPMEMLPQGMSPKKGDKITFCCTGEPDESGGVPGYFETAGAKDSSEDWEKSFLKEMSPRDGDDGQPAS